MKHKLDAVYTIDIVHDNVDLDFDAFRASLPSRADNLPDVYCERCKVWHPVSTKEDYDEMIAAQVKAVSDAIDLKIMQDIYAGIV